MTLAGRAVALLTALALTACSSSTEVGTRLETSLALDYGNISTDTTISVVGSTIVGAATVPTTCGAQHRADAGVRNGVVRLVVTDSMEFPVECMLIASAVRYIATAQPAPSGAFEVELVLREVVGKQVTTTTLKRESFALP